MSDVKKIIIYHTKFVQNNVKTKVLFADCSKNFTGHTHDVKFSNSFNNI